MICLHMKDTLEWESASVRCSGVTLGWLLSTHDSAH